MMLRNGDPPPELRRVYKRRMSSHRLMKSPPAPEGSFTGRWKLVRHRMNECLWVCRLWLIGELPPALPLRTRLRIVLETRPLGHIWSALQIAITIIACTYYAAYAYLSHIPGMEVQECIFGVAVMVDLVLRFTAADHRRQFLTNKTTLVDIASVVPLAADLVSYMDGGERVLAIRAPVFFRFVRVFKLLRFLRMFMIRKQLGTAVGQQSVVVALAVLSIMFISASLINITEGIAFGEAVYFCVVTMATVGYGDILVVSAWGRTVVCLLIVISFVWVPMEINTLTQMLALRSRFMSTYKAEKEKPNVLLVGHISATKVGTFLAEFFHPDRRGVCYQVVVLHNDEPEDELIEVLEDPLIEGRAQYVKGTIMNEEDLRRAGASSAVACFIFTDNLTSDDEAADAITVLRSLMIKTFRPVLPCYVQLRRTHNRSQLHMLKRQRIACLEELQMSILGMSAIYPGFATLLANLLTSSFSTKVASKTSPDWVREYATGADKEIYTVKLPDSFKGLKFSQAARDVFNQFEGRVMLLGIEERMLRTRNSGVDSPTAPIKSAYVVRRVLVNPGRTYMIDIHPEQQVWAFVLARDRESAEWISHMTLNEAHMDPHTPLSNLGNNLGQLTTRGMHFFSKEPPEEMVEQDDEGWGNPSPDTLQPVPYSPTRRKSFTLERGVSSGSSGRSVVVMPLHTHEQAQQALEAHDSDTRPPTHTHTDESVSVGEGATGGESVSGVSAPTQTHGPTHTQSQPLNVSDTHVCASGGVSAEGGSSPHGRIGVSEGVGGVREGICVGTGGGGRGQQVLGSTGLLSDGRSDRGEGGRQARPRVTVVDDVRSMAHVVDHVVVVMPRTASKLHYFLQPLRQKYLQGTEYNKAVVVLTECVPQDLEATTDSCAAPSSARPAFSEDVHEQLPWEVYVIEGQPHKVADLRRAGISSAHTCVILADRNTTQKIDGEVVDEFVVHQFVTIEKLRARMEPEARRHLNYVVEVLSLATLKILDQTYKTFKGKANRHRKGKGRASLGFRRPRLPMSMLRSPRGSIRQATTHTSHTRVPDIPSYTPTHAHADFDEHAHALETSQASAVGLMGVNFGLKHATLYPFVTCGFGMPVDLFDVMACQIFFNSGLLRFVDILLSLDLDGGRVLHGARSPTPFARAQEGAEAQSGRLVRIPLPRDVMGGTYGMLFDVLVADYDALPIALYRRDARADVHYVCTGPLPDTPLNSDDHVFVLAPSYKLQCILQTHPLSHVSKGGGGHDQGAVLDLPTTVGTDDVQGHT